MQSVSNREKTVQPPSQSGKKRKRSDDTTNIPPSKPRIMKETSPDLIGQSEPSPSDQDLTIPGPVPVDKNKKYEEIVFDDILDFKQKEAENEKVGQSETVQTGGPETGPLKGSEPGPSNVFHVRVKTPTKDDDIDPWPTTESGFQPFSTELTTPPKISYESDSYQFNTSVAPSSLSVPTHIELPSQPPTQLTSDPPAAEHLTVVLPDDHESPPKTPPKSSRRASRIEELRKLLSEPSPEILAEPTISTDSISPTESQTNTNETSPKEELESKSVQSSPEYEDIEVIDETREESDHENSDHENIDQEDSDHQKSDSDKSDHEESEVTLLDEIRDEDFQINQPIDESAPQNIEDLNNRNAPEEDKDFEITEVRTRFLPGLPSNDDVQPQPILQSVEPRRQSLTWKFPEVFVEVENDLESGSSGNIQQGFPDIATIQTEPHHSLFETGETSVYSSTMDRTSPIAPDLVAESEFRSGSSSDSSSSSSSPTGNSSSPKSSERSESPESPEFEVEPIVSSETKESFENEETTHENLIDPDQSSQFSENSIVSEEQKIAFDCPKGGLSGTSPDQSRPVQTTSEKSSLDEETVPATLPLEITPLQLTNNSPIITEETSPVTQCEAVVIATTSVASEPVSILKPVVLEADAVKRSVPDRPPTPGPVRRIPFSEFRSKSRPNSPVIRKHVRTTSMTSSSSEHEELEDENEEDLLKIIQRSSTRIKDVPSKKKVPPVVKPFVPELGDDSDDSIDLGPVDLKVDGM